MDTPALRPKRGNPNWGKPPQLVPHIATEFELQVRKLGLTKKTFAVSATLRAWCEHNKNRCYIPEWLLEEWGMDVNIYTFHAGRPGTSPSDKTGQDKKVVRESEAEPPKHTVLTGKQK